MRRPGSFGVRALRPMVVVASVWLAACPDNKPTEPAKPAPVLSSISVTLSAGTVVAGQTVTASAAGLDQFGASIATGAVTWSSSTPSIATVSASGLVTGVAAGSVQITGSAGGKSGSATLTVTVPPVIGVTVTPASANLTVGQTQQLTATPRDAAGNVLNGRTVTWTTSDASRATVSANGLVTAVSAGTASIVATCEGRIGGATITVAPVPVASVAVSPATASVLVGATQQLTATPRDASNNTLTGRTITWTTSDASRATVSSTGLVTGVAAGAATITAASEGKSASAAITVQFVAVASVSVAPSTASVLIGGTTTLTATARDAGGNALPGKTFTWTTSSSAIASGQYLNGVLTATGVSLGAATFTAVSEGKSGSATVTVTSGPTVTIAAVSPAVVVPGTSATITGSSFSTTASANAVSIGGVSATVTAATSTQLTVTLGTSYPCQATQNATVSVTVAGSTGTRQHPLQVATQLTFTAGQRTALLSDPAQRCNELSVTGGRYVLGLLNTSSSPSSQASVTVRAGSATATADPSGLADLWSPRFGRTRAQRAGTNPPRSAGDTRVARAARAHLQRLEADRAWASQMMSRRQVGANETAPGRVQRPMSVVVPTTVGSVVTLRYRSEGCGTAYETIGARVVAVTAHAIAVEDTLSPTARRVDPEIASMVNTYENSQYAVLAKFGDINVYDAGGALDNAGRLIMVFTPKVNAKGETLLGFAAACDLGATSLYPASNQTKVFWARVPTSLTGSATTADSKAWWAAYTPGTIVHEAKHVLQYAERFARNASNVEETWLEEGLAQVAVDLYSRSVYAGTTWNGNTSYAASVYCDHRIGSGSCVGGQMLMGDHFSQLYDFVSDISARSFLYNDPSNASNLYGGAWMFTRWLVDNYAGNDEAAFLRALTQTGLTGVLNVVARTSQSFGTLLADWALSVYADDDPSLVPAAGAKYTLPSWNLRSMWTGFNAYDATSYPWSFPLEGYAQSFGNWTVTTSLRGGGAAFIQLSGTQTAKQLLDLSALPSGSTIRLAILRIQ